MPPLFRFDDVWVRDGEQVILAGVTATIAEGGVTAIAGPSGSGKSTMLRLCNRLEVASSGSITFRSTELSVIDPIELRRTVGMVFQRPTPFPGTVFDNLRAAAPVDRAEAVALLDQVGLPAELLDQDALTLSGGEAQRMCTARTLATGCQVILADEVTSSLDAAATRVMESTARGLADTGRTIVWVTHDDAQRERIADRCIRIEEGRIVD